MRALSRSPNIFENGLLLQAPATAFPRTLQDFRSPLFYPNQITKQSKRTFLNPTNFTRAFELLSNKNSPSSGNDSAPDTRPAIRHPTHTCTVPYSRSTIFDAIISVDRYPEFLPLVSSAEITKISDDDSSASCRSSQRRLRSKVGWRGPFPTRARVKVGYASMGLEEDWESAIRVWKARSGGNYDNNGISEDQRTEEKGSSELLCAEDQSWYIEAEDAPAPSQSQQDEAQPPKAIFEVLKARWELQEVQADSSPTTNTTTASSTSANHPNTSILHTRVNLDLYVQFRSFVYDRLFGNVESRVAAMMVGAFENRVRQLSAHANQ